MQLMAGSVFTLEKLKEWQIIPESVMCPFCKNHDTIHHRLWTCTYGGHIRSRFPPALVTLAKIEGSDSALHTRCWNPRFGTVVLADELELRLFKQGKQVDKNISMLFMILQVFKSQLVLYRQHDAVSLQSGP